MNSRRAACDVSTRTATGYCAGVTATVSHCVAFLHDEVLGGEAAERSVRRVDDAGQHRAVRRLRPRDGTDTENGEQNRDRACHLHRGVTPSPRTRAPMMRTPILTSFGFDPTGTRYSIIISAFIRSARRSSAA